MPPAMMAGFFAELLRKAMEHKSEEEVLAPAQQLLSGYSKEDVLAAANIMAREGSMQDERRILMEAAKRKKR